MILVTSIMYSEIKYLKEWIEFHKKQDFKIVYIYLCYGNLAYGSYHDKNDELFQTISNEFIDVNFIHYDYSFHFHIKDFLLNHSKKHIGEWCAILDIDEFLHCPIENETIQDQIKFYEDNNIYNVYVNWRCYGSNVIIDNPTYEVVNKFTKPTELYKGVNLVGKSFFKITKDIKPLCNNSHFVDNSEKLFNSNGFSRYEQNNKNIQLYLKMAEDYRQIKKETKEQLYRIEYYLPDKKPRLLINHYMTRSLNEYKEKINLNKNKAIRYNLDFFNYINSL